MTYTRLIVVVVVVVVAVVVVVVEGVVIKHQLLWGRKVGRLSLHGGIARSVLTGHLD